MSSRRPPRLCFCNFCKGNNKLTRHKIAQHERIYGTWDAKNSKEGPSNAKKSRVSFEHNSSSESDNEQGALVILANEDTLIREDCDDGTDFAQLSINRSNSATLEVMYIDKYNIMKGGKTLHKVQEKNFKLDLVNLVCYHENESWHNVMFANEIVLLLLMYKYMFRI